MNCLLSLNGKASVLPLISVSKENRNFPTFIIKKS
nr:MAG TPA: hypothetical protein [Caudoviricetes sp.]